jgi:hypothetical protein
VNLGAAAVALRPRGLSEILDLACRLCVSLAFGLYARLSAALLLPLFAGCLLLRYALSWPWAAVWAIAVAATSVLQGVFTVGVGRLLFSEELGARQVLRLFGRRLGAYLGALSLGSMLLVASCVPLFAGLPFAWPHLVFVHEACLLEGAGPTDAIRRSSRFISGRAFPVLGALLTRFITQAAFVITAESLGQGFVSDVLMLGKPFGTLLSDFGSPFALAGFLLSIPFVSTARFLSYIDARTRSDGWDVQLRFMAITAAQGERSVPA